MAFIPRMDGQCLSRVDQALSLSGDTLIYLATCNQYVTSYLNVLFPKKNNNLYQPVTNEAKSKRR